MADTRTFPEVEFCHRTANDILTELVESWENAMGRKLSAADPIRVMLAWEASIDAQLYATINESARLNLPRYAFGDYLDSMAEIFYWGLQRIPATAATTTLRFTLSQAAEADTVVPAGTPCSRDGELIFLTDKTIYIARGETQGEVSAACTTLGTMGNGIPTGEIRLCMTPDAVKNLSTVENLTATSGGAARESDSAFYQRMRESMSAYSTAGSMQGYIYHTKSANANVGSVRVDSTEAGKVDIYILKTDGQLPDEALIGAVQESLSADTVRPLTDQVTVKAPEAVPFNIKVTWYRNREEDQSRAQMEANLEQAATEFAQWQTREIGRDINPDVLAAKLMGCGIKRLVVQEPKYTEVSVYQAAQLGEIQFTFGGDEDA